MRRAAGTETPRIGLHFVLTNRNHETLTDMVELAHAIGAHRVEFDALVAYRPEQLALKLSPRDLDRVPELASHALDRAQELGVSTTLQRFMDPSALERGERPPPIPDAPGLAGAPCLKAWHYLVVQADGRTSPCCVLAGQGGDASERPLDTLWHSDPFLTRVRKGMLNKAPLDRCRECSRNILDHEAHIRSLLPRA
jgi:MoaA/NifB/PqqE/SkfB family radical SAM enzyme